VRPVSPSFPPSAAPRIPDDAWLRRPIAEDADSDVFAVTGPLA